MSKKYCILCVDDDIRGLDARAALVEEEGYSVTSMSCPLRALESDVTKFHLAVLDFAMLALNGFQLLLRLRAAHVSFPIVLLSGMSHDVPNDMRRLFSSCLDKGEPIDLLRNTIRSFLILSPDSLECRAVGRRWTSPVSKTWALASGDPRRESRQGGLCGVALSVNTEGVYATEVRC